MTFWRQIFFWQLRGPQVIPDLVFGSELKQQLAGGENNVSWNKLKSLSSTSPLTLSYHDNDHSKAM